jgi:hypothetical protein
LPSAGENSSRNRWSRDKPSYIFIALRQAILNFPTRYARDVVGIADEHQGKAVLTKAAHEFLTELSSFPEKSIDPGWTTLEEDGEAPPAAGQPKPKPAIGAEIRAEKKRAKIRRAKKTETMRKLRAKG